MENYQFSAFRSREQSIKFYESLRAMRVDCAVINTPHEASIGCGISVKYPCRFENTAKIALERGRFSTFIGMYEVTENHGRKFIKLI
ncbi:MAG: putative Se/S carrier-like protein [Clostridia bacterium]